MGNDRSGPEFRISAKSSSLKFPPDAFLIICNSLFLQGQLLVDDALERLEWLGAVEQSAVDEKNRRAADADLGSGADVGLDGAFVLVGVQAPIELCGVEAQRRGARLEIRVGQLGGIREQQIVVRPELPLLGSALRRFGSLLCVWMDGQWKVTVHEMDLLSVTLEHLSDRRMRAEAERTLEVGELDEFDRRARGPLG